MSVVLGGEKRRSVERAAPGAGTYDRVMYALIIVGVAAGWLQSTEFERREFERRWNASDGSVEANVVRMDDWRDAQLRQQLDDRGTAETPRCSSSFAAQAAACGPNRSEQGAWRR